MATHKPQRTPEQIEDIILRKIFLVSLTDSTDTDPRIVYLEMTAAEILSEGKELRLSRDLMERILIDRLSGSFPSAEPPFQFLVGCYRRAYDEGKKIASMKDKNLRSEMESVTKQARKLSVSYCRIHLSDPELFSGGNPSKSNVSPLLSLIFSEVSSSVDGYGGSSSGGVSCPPGFLEDFFKDSDYDSLDPILKQLYEDLRGSVLKVSALGNFQQPLRALLFLVSFPVGAKSLVNHLWWIPKGVYLNGRVIEMTSILGPFFHVSALPDHTIFKSEPEVGYVPVLPKDEIDWEELAPLAKMTPRGKLFDVRDGADLNGLEDILREGNRQKEKVTYLTPEEIGDLKEAGYDIDSCTMGSKVQIVNEINEAMYEDKEERDEFEDYDGIFPDLDEPNEFESEGVEVDEEPRLTVENVQFLYEENVVGGGQKDHVVDEPVDVHEEKNNDAAEFEMPVGDDELNEEENSDAAEPEMPDKNDWTRPIIDSSDDEAKRTKFQLENMFEDYKDLREVKIGVYSRFKNAKVFRGVLKHYAAKKGFSYHFTRNDKHEIGVICKQVGCNFYIWCSGPETTNEISVKTFYDTHDCEKLSYNDRVTSDWLADRYLNMIRDNPTLDIESFDRIVHRDLETNVTKSRLYRALRRAKTIIGGDSTLEYKRLYDYLDVISKTNPESKWRVEVEHHANVGEVRTTPRFLRLYLRFGPEKKGFIAGCRPIVGIDGCHLKGYYGGQLLSAVTWDANDGMFPLAIAIVEQENKASWKWFLENLFDDYGDNRERGWVFISDKQKGLVELFKDWIPEVEHRHCMRHMYENWYKDFKSATLKNQLWKCAKANSAHRFEKEMEVMKSLDEKAYDWLRQRPAKEWCKAFFTERACSDIQTNSLSECFNSWLGKARSLPIISLCEALRVKMMGRYYAKKVEAESFQGLLCPNIYLLLESTKSDAMTCFAKPSGGGYFEVEDGGEKYCVNLESRSCSCMDFQLNGMPCKHAMAGIMKSKDKPENYVSSYYHTSTFNKIYEGQIFPVPGMSDWPTLNRPTLEPPIIQKPPGRPKKRRIRNEAENVNPYKASKKGVVMTCSRCKQIGHNIRSCTPKDYGETTAKRNERKNVKEKNVKGKNVKEKDKGISTNNNSAATNASKGKGNVTSSNNKFFNKTALSTAMDKKRASAIKKLERQRQHTSTLTRECTPQEIEAKKQAAIERLSARNNQQQQPQSSTWVAPKFQPKRQKLAVTRKTIRQEGRQQEQFFGPPTPIPSCGLAGHNLNNQRATTKKHFTPRLGRSRFSQDVSFSRVPNKGAQEQSSSQPPPRRSEGEQFGEGRPTSSSQP